MIALDEADLVVIAGRTLGLGTDAVLDRMDLGAARAALAEALSGQAPGLEFSGLVAATAGVGLILALLRHPPFPGPGRPVAVAAGLQFLSLNGWQADLEPPATAAVVVEALASGQLGPDDAAAWLAPRLSRAPRAGRARSERPLRRGHRAPAAARSGPGRPASRPTVRGRAGRAVAGAVLAVAVTGVTLLAAACSRGPGMTTVQPSPAASAQAARANAAYAACMRAHGVAGFSYPSASDVAAIAPAAGIGLTSLSFRAAEAACQR